jgi:hypothetical protein
VTTRLCHNFTNERVWFFALLSDSAAEGCLRVAVELLVIAGVQLPLASFPIFSKSVLRGREGGSTLRRFFTLIAAVPTNGLT